MLLAQPYGSLWIESTSPIHTNDGCFSASPISLSLSLLSSPLLYISPCIILSLCLPAPPSRCLSISKCISAFYLYGTATCWIQLSSFIEPSGRIRSICKLIPVGNVGTQQPFSLSSRQIPLRTNYIRFVIGALIGGGSASSLNKKRRSTFFFESDYLLRSDKIGDCTTFLKCGMLSMHEGGKELLENSETKW